MAVMQEEEAKNFESQRGIPRARLEAPEPVPIQSVGVGQFGGATMYAEASRFVRLPALSLVSVQGVCNGILVYCFCVD
jgi:hypothetical protein